MTRWFAAAPLAALLAIAAAAPSASAADRFATTDDSKTTQDCLTEATACALGRAMDQVPNPPLGANGTPNTLTLLPGDYDIADFDAGAGFSNFGSLLIKSGLLFQGKPGQPAPTINLTGLTAPSAGLQVNSGATLRHLGVVLNGPGAAISLSGLPPAAGAGDRPAIAERVNVTVNSASTTAFSIAITLASYSAAVNSRFSQTGGLAGQSSAVAVSPFEDAPARLFGVTALSPTHTAIAVRGGAAGAAKAQIFNTVARGAVDLLASSSSSGTPDPVTVELTNSAWRNAPPPTVTTGPATVVAKTPPVSGDPKLDGGGKPLEGSPLIDAGAALTELGTVDLDGNARVLGSAPDIGAYEAGGVTPPVTSCDPATKTAGTPAMALRCSLAPPPTTPPPTTTPPGVFVTPPPPDTRGPVATLSTPKSLKRSKLTKGKGVTLTATLDEPVVSAKVELLQITKKKGRAPKEKVLASATLGAGGPALRFTLKGKTSKLGKKGKLKLTLRFTFVDAFDNTTVVEKPVSVS